MQSLLPGQYGAWVRSARYDEPDGGEFDLFNHRLCWDNVCRHDPESSNDLMMEWLRRAAPMRDYRTPLVFHTMQGMLNKPDREFSLVPYNDWKRPSCNSREVHMVSGVAVRGIDDYDMIVMMSLDEGEKIRDFL